MPRKAPEPPVIRKADMLPAFAKKIMPPPPVLTLTEGGTAVSGRGCFECGSRVEADMKVCCRSGISAVVMRVIVLLFRGMPVATHQLFQCYTEVFG